MTEAGKRAGKEVRAREECLESPQGADDKSAGTPDLATAKLYTVFVFTTFLKLLLVPAYHSTDFDVHRNWLAITSRLPVSQWYYEATSEWTLDYPPFFAYFEWLLSRFVPDVVARDGALELVAVGQYGWPTVVFQRATVMLSELVLALSLLSFVKSKMPLAQGQKLAVAGLVWLSPGWVVLDHMHFQYNGMLYGILIFSFTAAANERYLLCASLFSALVCFKHIYLYLAPAYFGFLLRAYLIRGWRIHWLNCVKLGVATVAPFVLAFGPFYHDMPQVLSRLFPFSRGLTHAYWAPNFWALYSFADRVLGLVRKNATAAGTRGIVGQVDFSNLPTITPRVTFFLTAFYQLLALAPVMIEPGFTRFIECVTLCGFASFLFGWHVHEKAVLLVIVPFSVLAFSDRRLTASYQSLLVAGLVSLLTLIFTPAETLIKYTYTGTYLLVVLATLSDLTSRPAPVQKFTLRPTTLYIAGFLALLPALEAVKAVFPRYEFAPLMVLSVYCACGVMFSWVSLTLDYFSLDLVKTIA